MPSLLIQGDISTEKMMGKAQNLPAKELHHGCHQFYRKSELQFDIDALLAALRLGETQDWEFKSAKGGFPGSFWETYSAMANSEGGTIVLGVAERDGSAVADGLSDDQLAQYQKIIRDGARNKGIVNRDVLTVEAVEVVTFKTVKIVCVRIPRAGRTERPVHVKNSPFGNTYKRRYEGDYHCDDAEVRRMLADADPEPADSRILGGFGLEDLDPTSLTQYRQRLLASKGDHPWLTLDDRNLLLQLGGWRKDRQSEEEGLTLAGLLMFGKDRAIRDPKAAPAYFIDYRERLDPALRYTDRIYPDGTWEANLFQFYLRALPKMTAGLPTPFNLNGLERRDMTPAHEALREAFVNALIHADYRAEGGIVFERYPDRFVLENPGTLLVSVEQYHRGGTSECRNKALQTMFLLIGGGEHAGSGVARIKQGWASRRWRSPILEITNQPDRVRINMPMVSLIPEETLNELRKRYDSEIDSLSEGEIQALATAAIEGQVSNARLQELLDMHPVDITRLLVNMCGRGYLVSDNKRRWTNYHLGLTQGDSTHKEGDSTHKEGDSTHNDGDSTHNDGDSTHNDGDSTHNDGDNGQLELLDLDVNQLSRIAEAVAKSKRASPDTIRATILKMCAVRPLSADEIGSQLNRDAKNVQQRYLGPMVQEGLLALKFPQTPNRPDQAYKTVEDTGAKK